VVRDSSVVAFAGPDSQWPPAVLCRETVGETPGIFVPKLLIRAFEFFDRGRQYLEHPTQLLA
jgi:hypothetical protein